MRKSGFTLVEMLAVLLILALLAAALTAGLSTARNNAWRAKARDTCRQLCTAWNAYLLDCRKFPDKIPNNGKELTAEYVNIKWLSPEWLSEEEKKRHNGRIYLEISETEKNDGLKDHWDQPIYFSLDMDYDGQVDNKYPDAFDPRVEQVKATSISWSLGDPNRKKRVDNPIVVW